MNRLQLFCFLLCIVALSSCSKNKAAEDTKGFPKNVAAIINTKCAVTGCHTDNSFEAASGLSLSSWTAMFAGGYSGADVIPYRADESWLCYFVNTYPDLGIVLSPTMPVNTAPYFSTPLSREEVILLQQWINNGAPDEAGDIAFPADPKRDKFYVVNQGCGEVTVFDTNTKLAMRYIHVNDAQNTTPHSIEVSPDGQYWYVIYYSGEVIKKYKTSDDSYVGEVNIGFGSWNTMSFDIINGTTYAFAINFASNGSIAYVDLDNLKLIKTYQNQGRPAFSYPHGSAISHDHKTLYVTSQTTNVLYKINISNPLSPTIQNLNIDTGLLQSNSDSLGMHVVGLTPDGSKYFITCQAANKVLEFLSSNDSLIKVFNVGTFPQEMAFSTTKPYLFVTCMEDPSNYYLSKGSVQIINYETNELLPTKLQDGLFQPHGIAVDDKNGLVIVPSLDWDAGGPAPHHVSTCGGNNGYVQLINLNTLTFLSTFRAEVSVYPYFVAVKN